ncbi:hypothetical protein D3C85_1822870 [compost metagenome]
MQLDPGQQVVVARLGQVATGGGKLLFGIEYIEVDPLAPQYALTGRNHQGFGRGQRPLVGTQAAGAG